MVLANFLVLALPALAAAQVLTQEKASWNLRAISHRSPHKLPQITKLRNFKYYYRSSEAEMYAYVLDSGIRVSHQEFEGRAENFYTVFKTPKANFEDGNGHGTHVAGIIAAKTHGVAKKARLLSVKVLNTVGRGDLSQAVAGYNAAVNDIVDKGRQHKAVINISAGWSSCSRALSDAIDKAYDTQGILTVVAGNEGDISQCTPTDSKRAMIVGAAAENWNVASFSNFRYPVSIFAPGVNILSLSKDGDAATATKSGTSMAAPHVAALALNAMSVFSKQNKEVVDFLRDTATRDKLRGVPRELPNLLVNNNNDKQEACKSTPDNDDC